MVKTLSSGVKRLELDFLCGLGQVTFLSLVSASLSIRVMIIVKMEWVHNKCSLTLARTCTYNCIITKVPSPGGDWRSKCYPTLLTKPWGITYAVPGIWKLLGNSKFIGSQCPFKI